MGRKKPNFQDVNPVDPQGGKLKKAMAIDDNKYEVETDSCEELMASEVRVVTVGLKKKGKKGGSRKFEPNDKIFDEMHVEEEDKDVPVGRNKVKSKMGVGKNVFGASSFELLREDDESGTSCVEDDGDAVITFSGKKKSSKGKNNSAFSALDDSIELVDAGQAPVDTSSKESENLRNSRHASKAVTEPLRNRKKGKKSGKAAQEEDDLEKILAEIGEGSSFTEAVPLAEGKVHIQHRVEKVDVSSEEKAGGGGEETAAQKKKRKKKEKEKEKKVAATAAAHVDEPKQDEETNETKSKPIDKKVSKPVRAMQEKLARLNEEIERKKRVEEEKLRKEQEERKRLEELERLEEERKRAKKEREKEKLLKKKLEGKLLTGKQKVEARRREAMRSQILANAGGLPLSTGDAADAPAKRPKYETKKSKQRKSILKGVASGNVTDSIETVKENHQDFVTKEVSMEPEIVEESDAMSIEDDQLEAASVMEGNENGWNAKSWEDAVLKLPGEGAFSDKEESELVEKFMDPKLVVPTVLPIKSSSIEDKRSQPVKMVTDKNKPKDPVGKKSVLNENLQCNEGEKILRSPICCIMGHVDTGKTKLLDRIRGTNVQEGEAGGITQQIGATFFPAENIRERTKELKADAKLEVPGLLVIDTPGHESFKNLRSRGSGLCDIAILVVDIMHGLEPQTIESLNLLKTGNTEFIVALNKVDRLYGWKTCKNAPIVKAMKQQNKDVQIEFNTRLTQVITQFKEQGLNTELYYKNKHMEDTYNIIPTSAISGEGIPDMLLWVVQWTQKKMAEKLTYSNKVQCAVLEVKVVEGLGTTIDVILVNGVLHEGDKIVVCSLQEPIVTTIRALLTPHPMKELRVKGTYLHHKEIKAAQGIKITAQGLEHAVAGTSLYVVGPHDDIDGIKNTAMEDVKSVFSKIDKNSAGVYVQASTLGSLEALLEFLKSPEVNIPVSNISIGPVHKKDVVKASVMLEKKKEYATILAFDVKVTPEATVLADEAGVKIFTADIIYHLCDQFKSYINKVKEGKKKEAAEEVVFPCVLEILACFNNRDPIILGVDVLEGILKVGTPLCISSENPSKNFMDIGRVISIQKDKIEVDCAKKGGPPVAIKISGTCADEQQKSFSRHFDDKDKLVSRISRKSIDILKKNYRDEVAKDEWVLIKKLKADFKIQ